MKRIFLSAAVLSITSAGIGQVRPVKTAKISTPNIGCEDCKTRIETYLKRHDGVTYVLVNWRRKETIVKFVVDRINIEEIKTAIANLGYDADDVPANEDSYKRLPKTCKKPEDGGPSKPPNIHAPPPPKPNN